MNILHKILGALVAMGGSFTDPPRKERLGTGKSEVRHLSKSERQARLRRFRLSTCQKKRRRYQ